MSPEDDIKVHMSTDPINSIRELAALVRGRRQQLGLTQEQVAELADVSRQWISKFEAGRSDIGFFTLLRILGALDLDLSVVDEAVAKAGDPPPDEGPPTEDIDLDELLNRFRKR